MHDTKLQSDDEYLAKLDKAMQSILPGITDSEGFHAFLMQLPGDVSIVDALVSYGCNCELITNMTVQDVLDTLQVN